MAAPTAALNKNALIVGASIARPPSTGEPEGMSGDNVRDEYLGRLGLTVCRYQNSEVMKNFDGVCTDIFIRLNGTEFE